MFIPQLITSDVSPINIYVSPINIYGLSNFPFSRIFENYMSVKFIYKQFYKPRRKSDKYLDTLRLNPT